MLEASWSLVAEISRIDIQWWPHNGNLALWLPLQFLPMQLNIINLKGQATVYMHASSNSIDTWFVMLWKSGTKFIIVRTMHHG